MIEVTQARHLGSYRIEIAFNTGESGVVDLAESLWGPEFEPLRTPQRFRRFTVSPTLHTITWDNDADFAPECLREKMIEQALAAAPARRGFAGPECRSVGAKAGMASSE
jgi:hypothetical protein